MEAMTGKKFAALLLRNPFINKQLRLTKGDFPCLAAPI